MSKHRRAARADTNQAEIVAALRQIPGVTVQTGMDDIIVGRSGKTFWFELKTECPLKKDGTVKKGALKQSQIKLLREWTGHYNVVWTLDQILKDIGIGG